MPHKSLANKRSARQLIRRGEGGREGGGGGEGERASILGVYVYIYGHMSWYVLET